MKPVPLDDLSFQKFRELLRSHFQVIANSRRVELQLIEATARCAWPVSNESASDNFSLIFAGPLDPYLEQGTYRFEQEMIGAFDLFIVPVSKGANGFEYEAIINRVRKRIR